MDLNNIELPAFAIADLYKSSLIDSGDKLKEKLVASSSTGDAIRTTASRSFAVQDDNKTNKWLGNNRKNILIVVDHADVVHIPDADLQFLTEILAACKLSMGDLALINIHNHSSSSYRELTGQFKSKIVFLFGVAPTSFGLPLNFPHFQLQAFAGTKYLFSPALKELEVDKLLKSKLWVCLKKIFGL